MLTQVTTNISNTALEQELM